MISILISIPVLLIIFFTLNKRFNRFGKPSLSKKNVYISSVLFLNLQKILINQSEVFADAYCVARDLKISRTNKTRCIEIDTPIQMKTTRAKTIGVRKSRWITIEREATELMWTR